MSSKNPQIFITKFPQETNEEDIRKHFKKFGKIKEITMKKGFSFVVSVFLLIKIYEQNRTVGIR